MINIATGIRPQYAATPRAKEANGTPWLVWVLMLLNWVAAAHTSFHIDTARDLAYALDIVDGSRFHLSGPEIGYAFRLGPLWFYVLALPLALGVPIAFIPWFTAAVSSVQYWLAWRLGASILNRSLGLCFALALSLPSWKQMYWLASTHTILTVPAVLATLVAWTAYWNRPSTGVAFLGGLAAGVAMHGHPSTVPLVLLLSLPIIRPAARGRRAAAVLWGVGGLVLLFVPVLVDQAMAGWSDWHQTGAYVAAQDWIANLGALPQVITNAIVGAAPAATELTLRQHPTLEEIVKHLAWIGLVIGIFGLPWAWRERSLRLCLGIALALAAANLILVTALRSYVTHYSLDLTTVLSSLVIGIGWYGMLRLLETTSIMPRWLPLAACGSVILLNVLLVGGWLENARAGSLVAPIDRGLSLQQTGPSTDTVLEPAVFFGDLPFFQRQVCTAPQPVIHGDAALVHDLMGDVLGRSGCNRPPLMRLGGAAYAGAPDIAGVACAIIEHAAVRPIARQGQLCWLPVSRNLNSGPGVLAADTQIYLPHRRRAGKVPTVYTGTIAADEIIVLTFLLPYWADFSEPTMVIAGRQVAPFYKHHRTFAWEQATSSPYPQEFVVTIDTALPEAVDLIALAKR